MLQVIDFNLYYRSYFVSVHLLISVDAHLIVYILVFDVFIFREFVRV